MKKKYDRAIALLLGLLSCLFLVLLFTNGTFLNWVFARHQNQMSWYIRPLFLLPFCYAAYRRSWAGISATVFCMLTSMFWFHQPAHVPHDVTAFLQFEINWISGEWGLAKILSALAAPFSFFILGLAFWRRKSWIGLLVVALIAMGKITWSISQAGDAGKSIVVPALIGLIVCALVISYGHKRR